MSSNNLCCCNDDNHLYISGKYGININALAHTSDPLVVHRAAELVPKDMRKPGTKITFWTFDGWQTWQFIPLDVREWLLPASWKKETSFGQEDIADLQNQIDSLQISGMAVSQELGTDPHIGISQKTLTEQIGFDNIPNTIKGRINTLETEVGEGGSVDERIAAAKSQIIGTASSGYDTLGEVEIKIKQEVTDRNTAVTTEKNRAEAAEDALRNAVGGLTQSDIVIGALPATGQANKIYRVPGTNSYSDYSWNGSQFVPMATYNNAIDDVPTANSNNLVKSGGVYGLSQKLEYVSQQADGIISNAYSVVMTDGGIGNDNLFATNRKKYLIPCTGITNISFTSSNAITKYAFIKDWDFTTNEITFATGYTGIVQVNAQVEETITSIPTDAKYFYLQAAFVFSGDWAYNVYSKFEINSYDVKKSVVEHFESLQNDISQTSTNLSAVSDRVGLVEILCNGEQIVPSSSVTLVAGQTNNLFDNKNYVFKKGQRVRFVMSGVGSLISSYRWYDRNNNYTDVYSEIYEFVADNDFGLKRVLVRSASIISTGTVTFNGYAIGFQQAITEIKETLSVLPPNLTLSTLQTAAGVTGNLFTSSFTFYIDVTGNDGKPIIVKMASKYLTTQDYDSQTANIPTIQFGSDFIHSASNYNDIIVKEWRFLPDKSLSDIAVSITIPSGVQLIISSINCITNDCRSKGDYLIYNHGAMNGGNFCTQEMWDDAARCGAYGVIAVPKRTSDGVWVVFHDDGDVNGVMMNSDGSAISSGITIANSTYSETQNWRYKTAYKSEYNINADGTTTTNRIPKLEDFFKTCAKTGMHPCLSWHPFPSVTDQSGHYRDFEEVRLLAIKYGVLSKLTIKIGYSGVQYFTGLYDVFGNSLEMVLLDVSGTLSYANTIAALQSDGADIFDKTKIKYGIEYSSEMSSADGDIIEQLIADGYIVGMCYVNDGKRMDWCIGHGILEYTLDYFYSWGINW